MNYSGYFSCCKSPHPNPLLARSTDTNCWSSSNWSLMDLLPLLPLRKACVLVGQLWRVWLMWGREGDAGSGGGTLPQTPPPLKHHIK